jgi:signal-transduction protein with cAMP-binding, CBS, and nucleotidyltransferase domain
MMVKEVMTENPITVTGGTEIFKAAKILLDNRINGVPVVDEAGKLVGILCQSDIIAQQKKLPLPSLFSFLDGYISLSSTKNLEKEVRKIAATAVVDAMTRNPVTVAPNSSIETVAALMVDQIFPIMPRRPFKRPSTWPAATRPSFTSSMCCRRWSIPCSAMRT